MPTDAETQAPRLNRDETNDYASASAAPSTEHQSNAHVPKHLWEEAIKDPEKLVQLTIRALEFDKAEDLTTIDLKNQATFADYMIIATGRSARQVIALADKMIERLKGAGNRHIKAEGLTQGDWVLIDAGDIVIHLFKPEVREFYNIEKIWGAGTEDTRPQIGNAAPPL